MICGPIIRRIEGRKVSVWAAFMNPQHVVLNIYKGDSIKHTGSNRLFNSGSSILAGTAEGHALQFGQHLWVALITVELTDTPDTNLVYSYNMIYNDLDAAQSEDFLSDKLLTKDKTAEDRPQLPIGYEDKMLPSFVFPGATPKQLNIVHGSCRKLHGHGQDALALLDDKIKTTRTAPATRPQALFLTGDQIYADEVPGIVLRSLGSMDGVGLFGGPRSEKMKIKDGNNPAQEFETDITAYPPYFRQKLVNKYAGFSSQAATNHLITFEEFCATYLYYWNVRSWNKDIFAEVQKIITAKKTGDFTKLEKALDDAVTKFTDSPAVDADTNLVNLIRDAENVRQTDAFIFSAETITKTEFRDNNNEKYKKWLKDTKKDIREEFITVAEFLEKLPAVSRVLANVPCYMMMDDHEVTDDWGITQRWNNLVMSKPFGRDIIRNAMMAYAVFQDWGNVPTEYQEAINLLPAQFETATNKRAQFLMYASEFGFRYAANQKLNTIRTEVIDKMEIMLGMGATPTNLDWNYSVKLGTAQALVLDTRTKRAYESLNTTPQLISAASLTKQTPETLLDNPPFLFVVSPCPVLGFHNFEELIQPAATAVIALATSNEDNPGLIGGQLNFDYEAWGFNTDAFERFMARMDKYKSVIFLSGDVHYGATTVMDYWKGASATPTSRIVQLTSSGFKNEWLSNVVILKSALIQQILSSFVNGVSKLGWFNKTVTSSNSNKVTPRNRQRLLKSTVTIPVEGWTPGITLNPVPDFRWRLKVLKDERAMAGDPVTAEIAANDSVATKEGYFNIVKRHQKMFKDGKTRRIAWNSNIGLVSFVEDGTGWKLKHELLGVNMLFEVPLTTPVAERTKPALP